LLDVARGVFVSAIWLNAVDRGFPLSGGNHKHQESDDSEDNDEEGKQQATDDDVGHSFLFRAGVGDAECGNEGLGQPGKEFHGFTATPGLQKSVRASVPY
jgi:hypothetical protein